MRTMEHDEVQELLGAYALDAVEPDEAASIEAHLADCPRCRAEVAGYREVTGMFAFAGQEAPPGVWARIAAGMHEDTPPLRLDRIRPGMAPGPPGSARTRPGAPRRVRMARQILAVAAAIAIVVLAVQVARLSGRSPTRPHGVLTMADVQAALRSPGSRRVVLLAPGAAGRGASVDAVVEPDGRGYIYDSHLVPLSADRTYQLWGVVGGARISYGLLGTSPGIVAFQGGTGLRTLAITDEVASGVVTSHHPFTVAGPVSPPL